MRWSGNFAMRIGGNLHADTQSSSAFLHGLGQQPTFDANKKRPEGRFLFQILKVGSSVSFPSLYTWICR